MCKETLHEKILESSINEKNPDLMVAGVLLCKQNRGVAYIPKQTTLLYFLNGIRLHQSSAISAPDMPESTSSKRFLTAWTQRAQTDDRRSVLSGPKVRRTMAGTVLAM